MHSLLVTGGCGFIGSHFTEYILRTTEWNVVVLDRLDSTASLNRLSHLIPEFKNRLKIIWWDLKAELNQGIKHQLKNIDRVIHTAASSHVDRSIVDPSEFVMDNIVGTMNLLNWIKDQNNIQSFLHCSTDEVFGSADKNSIYTPSSATFPENPYAATKAGAESLVISYACTYKLPLSIARMTNVIGIKQHPEKFIPSTIRKILNEEVVEIYCSEDKQEIGSRYYVDIKDINLGLLQILTESASLPYISKEHRFRGIFQFSGPQEVGNLQVAELIGDRIGKNWNYKLEPYPTKRPYHDLNYRISSSTMNHLGWYSKIDIEKSIIEIVDWTLQNQEWLEL
jgi:dTDP-glucose 4,6-dehydratase